MTVAVQPHFPPAATSITSGMAMHQANARQFVEDDAIARRPLDRPATMPRPRGQHRRWRANLFLP